MINCVIFSRTFVKISFDMFCYSSRELGLYSLRTCQVFHGCLRCVEAGTRSYAHLPISSTQYISPPNLHSQLPASKQFSATNIQMKFLRDLQVFHIPPNSTIFYSKPLLHKHIPYLLITRTIIPLTRQVPLIIYHKHLLQVH